MGAGTSPVEPKFFLFGKPRDLSERGAFRPRCFPATSSTGAGEWGPPNLPKFSPMANGYTHAECYYTARQIWTKDVWKHAVLRTDVLSHQIYSLLPPKSPPKPHFWWPFNAKPIIHGALRKSHINGATKLKLYSYIGMDKYLGNGVCQKFSARGRPGGAWPLNANLGPHIFSKTTRARKLKLETQLDVVKYSLRV